MRLKDIWRTLNTDITDLVTGRSGQVSYGPARSGNIETIKSLKPTESAKHTKHAEYARSAPGFLERKRKQIEMLSESCRKTYMTEESFQNGVNGIERTISRLCNDISLILNNPGAYVDRVGSDSWMNYDYVLGSLARKRLLKKGLQSKLSSIKGYCTDLEGYLDLKEQRIDSIIADISPVKSQLETYCTERRKIGWLGEKQKQNTDQAEKYLEALDMLESSLEQAREFLHSKQDDISQSVTKQRACLESQLDDISRHYNLIMKDGSYGIRKRKNHLNHLKPALAAAGIAACMISGAYITGSLDGMLDRQLNKAVHQSSGLVQTRTAGRTARDTISEDSRDSLRYREHHASPDGADDASQTGPETQSEIDLALLDAPSMNKECQINKSFPVKEPDNYRMLDERFYDIPGEVRQLNLDTGEVAVYINKDAQRMSVYMRTDWVKAAEYIISTGMNAGDKRRSGDHKTPETPLEIGSAYKEHFRISQIHNSSSWTYNGIRGAYGPWFMRLDCGRFSGTHYSTNGRCPIGIHGTPERWEPDLGTRASHGCIRMYDEDVDELRDIVQIGTPVLIPAPGSTNEKERSRDGSMYASGDEYNSHVDGDALR
ncbi:L,D-transpeptidase family protein [Candidatus Woesearchaeota archaeon]|nr:L,D-transpeptidase family protein [Candidatus Woesearchaeota archaeon]